jgi:hypothetical protein
MKLNHMGYSANLKLFLGVLLAVCFLAATAHADPPFKGRFTLTHQVHWGKTLLGPGSYSLAIDDLARTIIIRDPRTGKIVARQFAWSDYHADNSDSELLIAVRGHERFVYSVRLAGLGEVYFQSTRPFGARLKATEQARNAEAIPVEVAKK